MKCIDDELIQKYIDGESDSQEKVLIEKHLADCSQCTENVAKQKSFAVAIKSEIGNWGRKPDIIPEFIAPSVRKHRLNLKIRHYIYAVSVACAILLFLYIRYEQNVTDQSIHLIYTFDGDFNSNRTVLQQDMTFIMIDDNGNIVE